MVMRLKALAAILALGTSALNARPIPPADQQRSADPRDLHHCKLRAARTADNDIRLDPDRRLKPRPSELPAPVARRILDHVTQVAKNQFTVKEWIEDQHTCDFVFSPIFRLDAPADPCGGRASVPPLGRIYRAQGDLPDTQSRSARCYDPIASEVWSAGNCPAGAQPQRPTLSCRATNSRARVSERGLGHLLRFSEER